MSKSYNKSSKSLLEWVFVHHLIVLGVLTFVFLVIGQPLIGLYFLISLMIGMVFISKRVLVKKK